MDFALLYDVVCPYVERRKPFRAEHLALAQAELAAGRLVMGGASDPPDGALLVFRAASAAEVEAFVARDPYGLARDQRAGAEEPGPRLGDRGRLAIG